MTKYAELSDPQRQALHWLLRQCARDMRRYARGTERLTKLSCVHLDNADRNTHAPGFNEDLDQDDYGQDYYGQDDLVRLALQVQQSYHSVKRLLVLIRSYDLSFEEQRDLMEQAALGYEFTAPMEDED